MNLKSYKKREKKYFDENKHITISDEIHKNLKKYCKDNKFKFKKYVEFILENHELIQNKWLNEN